MSDNTIADSTRFSLRLWLRLLTCNQLIENEIRGQLRKSFDITLPRFDVMAQLYRYPDGLRMGEISKLLMVTGGNITGIIDQLEQEMLVQRMVDSADRRVTIAKLTPKGIGYFEEIADIHHGWIDNLLDGIDAQSQAELYALLEKLQHSLEEKLNQDDQ